MYSNPSQCAPLNQCQHSTQTAENVSAVSLRWHGCDPTIVGVPTGLHCHAGDFSSHTTRGPPPPLRPAPGEAPQPPALASPLSRLASRQALQVLTPTYWKWIGGHCQCHRIRGETSRSNSHARNERSAPRRLAVGEAPGWEL